MNRLREIRTGKKITQEQLAERAGTSRQQIIRLENGTRKLTEEWIERLAAALGVQPYEIITSPSDMPKGRAETMGLGPLPVMGTAAGALRGGAMLVDQSDPIAWVRRPPGIAQERDVYVLHMAGNSMAPRYLHGEPIYIIPHGLPLPGDHVVVYTQTHDGAAQEATVGRLKTASGDWLTLIKYNPQNTEVRLSRKYVSAIHRILTPNELFGL